MVTSNGRSASDDWLVADLGLRVRRGGTELLDLPPEELGSTLAIGVARRPLRKRA